MTARNTDTEEASPVPTHTHRQLGYSLACLRPPGRAGGRIVLTPGGVSRIDTLVVTPTSVITYTYGTLAKKQTPRKEKSCAHPVRWPAMEDRASEPARKKMGGLSSRQCSLSLRTRGRRTEGAFGLWRCLTVRAQRPSLFFILTVQLFLLPKSPSVAFYSP
jgi:hypothetical protein